MVGPRVPGAMLMAIYWCSCAAGAAAAGGQAGQREPGCRPEHHREIHLPPQVQEGERPKTASRLPALLSWPRVVGTERTEGRMLVGRNPQGWRTGAVNRNIPPNGGRM